MATAAEFSKTRQNAAAGRKAPPASCRIFINDRQPIFDPESLAKRANHHPTGELVVRSTFRRRDADRCDRDVRPVELIILSKRRGGLFLPI
jgi:hypothetical protein